MTYRRNYITFRLLDAFFRHWRVFLLSVVLINGIVVMALLSRKPTYGASASIRVIADSDLSKALGMVNQNWWVTPSDENVRHFGDLMRNVLPGGFVDTALKSANLNKPINVDPQSRDPRFEQLVKKVYASSDSKDVFTIGLVWDNKEECERIVNALQQSYIQEAGLSRQMAAVNQTQFFNNQLATYKKRMDGTEQALINYKMKNAGQLPEAQASEIERYSNLRMERDILMATSKDDELKKQTIQSRMSQVKPTSILEQTVTSDPIRLQIRQLQAKRNTLLEDWTPTSSLVTAVDKQIANLEVKLASQQASDPLQSRNVVETRVQDNPEYRDLEQQLTTVTIDQNQHRVRLASLDQLIAQYDERIRRLPLAERELTERTRDYTVIKEQYETLLKRREDAQLKASVDRITATSAMMLQNPIYAEDTTGAKKKLMMMAGTCVLGLVVGCLMIVLREWSDPSLRYDNDTARLLGVPVLASLPESSDLIFPLPAPRNNLLRRLKSGNGITAGRPSNSEGERSKWVMLSPPGQD